MSWTSQDTDLRSFPADKDLSDATLPGTFVHLGPAQNVAGYDQGGAACVGYDPSKGDVCGVLMNRPSNAGVDFAATIRVRNVEKVRCGAAWAINDKITHMAGGLGKPAGGSDQVCGIARSSAVVGDLAPVDLTIC